MNMFDDEQHIFLRTQIKILLVMHLYTLIIKNILNPIGSKEVIFFFCFHL